MRLILFVLGILLFSGCNLERPLPPQEVFKLANREESLVRLPDGNFMLFRIADGNLVSMTSPDGHSWSTPKVEMKNQDGADTGFSIAGLMLVDDEGELHNVRLIKRLVPESSEGFKGPGTTIMLDIQHNRTTHQRTVWGTPKIIFEGYCGAVLDFKQLRSGRLIIPFAYWVAGQAPLPRGLNISTVLYSDDRGSSWTISKSKITAPTYGDYAGNNYGAIEPGIVELEQDGHLYMVLRSQTGFIYESYSMDNGTNWVPAVASRFYSFNGPPLIKETSEGKIFMVWNNCDSPPRYDGQIVYGGRDAIHAAISDDYGKTWKGFREIHRDPLRNESPPKRGDRGTAYANSPVSVGNDVMLITGMGEGRRHIVKVDINWLTAKHHKSDFSNGLDEWTVFKQFGPVDYYWRDREAGPQLINHPEKEGKKILHIRRPDERDGDGAVWNFPNGQNGKLTLRLMLNNGFKGGCISLTDRFFNPCDNYGDSLAMFSLSIGDNGLLDGASISMDQWHIIEFAWSISAKSCKITCDGKSILTLPLKNKTLNGLSYLRLRSIAQEKDTAGYFIESVVVNIDDDTAPSVNEKEKKEMEMWYRTTREKIFNGKAIENEYKRESGYLM